MIILGLGANLDSAFGSPEVTIRRAMDLFESHGIGILAGSTIWKTAPVPISDQPWYRNAVCSIQTRHNPYELLDVIRKIESDFGRIRSVQDAPRVIDIDILSYNGIHIETNTLQIPHPRMHERAFVLYPLREISPEWVHPLSGMGINELIAQLPAEQDIEKI